MSQMEFKYDVFISYSRKNKEWVEKELLKRLNETGITSILDVSHFKIGEDLIEAIEQAILSSRKTIIVLTPAYLESEYCSYELQVVLSLDPAARKKKILLLVLEECVIPAKLKRLIHADFKNKDIWEDSFEQLLESLGYLGIDLEKHLPHTKSDYSYSNSPLQLMEIYLINNSGIRIDYKASGRRSGKDEDILAGMLKGVISIPEDVWKKGGHIKKIETENLNFIIETNENIAIIVVIKGHEISGIRNTIRDCINIIQNRFGSVLADWSGDMKELEEIKEVIDDLDEELK